MGWDGRRTESSGKDRRDGGIEETCGRGNGDRRFGSFEIVPGIFLPTYVCTLAGSFPHRTMERSQCSHIRSRFLGLISVLSARSIQRGGEVK